MKTRLIARAWCAVALAWLSACSLSPPPRAQSGDPLARIEHILVVFEENRSFDNLFGQFPGANGLSNAGDAAVQRDLSGRPYVTLPPVMDTYQRPPKIDLRFPQDLPNRPFPIDAYLPGNVAIPDLVHRFYQEQAQINGGKMDRFAAISDAGGLTMGYHDLSKTAHWRLASTYALADNMFHSAFGGSFLNHSFLVCACAFEWPNAPDRLVAKLDANGRMIRDGQVSPDGFAINTSRSVYLHAPTDTDPTLLVPPQTMPHIGDRLDARGVSWAWYSGGYDDAAAGKPAKSFQFHHQPLAYFANLAPGTPGQREHLKDLKDLLVGIDRGTLPQVAFYKPIGELNLHPGYATIADGDRHLDELITRLRNSSLYRNTLVIITYDENGGLWDHVAPPKRDRWGPGSRVPLIAVGPMVKRGYVDHTQYEFGSILRTIEARFGVEPLNAIDASAHDLRPLLD